MLMNRLRHTRTILYDHVFLSVCNRMWNDYYVSYILINVQLDEVPIGTVVLVAARSDTKCSGSSDTSRATREQELIST